MLAIFSDGTEVIICEVDSEGQPIKKGYFPKDGSDERDIDEYDYSLVEGPIQIQRGSMTVNPERTLTS